MGQHFNNLSDATAHMRKMGWSMIGNDRMNWQTKGYSPAEGDFHYKAHITKYADGTVLVVCWDVADEAGEAA